MRTIGLSGTTDTVPRNANEPLGKCSLSKELVTSVALTILDTQHDWAPSPDPGGQNAPHNAFFSRGIQRDLPALRTRSSCHSAILQSGKAHTQAVPISCAFCNRLAAPLPAFSSLDGTTNMFAI
jgi:hypothetical protein